MYERSKSIFHIYQYSFPLAILTVFAVLAATCHLQVIGFDFTYRALWEAYAILLAAWGVTVSLVSAIVYHRSVSWKRFVPDDFTAPKKAFMASCFLKKAIFYGFPPAFLFMTIAAAQLHTWLRYKALDFVNRPALTVLLAFSMATNVAIAGQMCSYITDFALYLKPWHLYGRYYDMPDEPETMP